MRNIEYKHTIYACYIGYIVQAIINNLGPLLFLTFEKSLGIPIEKIGMLITINFGVQIIVDLLSARYVDKIGYRNSIIAAHIFASIGLIGMGIFPFIFSDSFVGLAVSSMINAVGGGIIEVLISPIVEAAPSNEKDKAMSMLHSFYCFGHVAVVILSTVAFYILGMDNWRYISMIWAIVPLFNIFLFSIVPIKAVTEEESQLPLKRLLSMKLFWIFVLLMICAGASEQAMSQWASFFAEDGLKVSKTMGDLLGPCAFALLMGGSRAFYGKYGSRIDLKKFILGSSILCIISYLIAVLSPVPIIGLLGCALCGLSVGIMWPGTFSIAAKECPNGGTAMWALLALAGDIGCSVGPGLVSIISSMNIGTGIKYGLGYAIIFPATMFMTILKMTVKHSKH